MQATTHFEEKDLNVFRVFHKQEEKINRPNVILLNHYPHYINKFVVFTHLISNVNTYKNTFEITIYIYLLTNEI